MKVGLNKANTAMNKYTPFFWEVFLKSLTDLKIIYVLLSGEASISVHIFYTVVFFFFAI